MIKNLFIMLIAFLLYIGLLYFILNLIYPGKGFCLNDITIYKYIYFFKFTFIYLRLQDLFCIIKIVIYKKKKNKNKLKIWIFLFLVSISFNLLYYLLKYIIF